MLLNLHSPIDRNKATAYLTKLIDQGAKVELRKIQKPRSMSQNKYMHVVITLFGIHHGYSIDEAKTFLKRRYDKSHTGTFAYYKDDEVYYRSTSGMDTKEVTDWIEWIRHLSGSNGHYIPTSEEYLIHKFSIDREIDAHKEFI